MSFMPYQLVPAYGRSYGTAEEFLADWNSNKDMMIKGGPYCNKQDLQAILDTGCKTVYTEVKGKTVYLVRFGEVVDHG